ncbi:unnamed protein product [Camellia sinensis]
MNSECRGHAIPREEMPTVDEELRCMTEQQRAKTEELRIQSAKVQKIKYVLFMLPVIGALSLMKM